MFYFDIEKVNDHLIVYEHVNNQNKQGINNILQNLNIVHLSITIRIYFFQDNNIFL